MEKKYIITGNTNAWIAQRDSTFNGKPRIIIEEGLTLREAQKKLLEMFNEDYEDRGWYAVNWGITVNISSRLAAPTFNDGTRQYEYDSRVYRIEEQE